MLSNPPPSPLSAPPSAARPRTVLVQGRQALWNPTGRARGSIIVRLRQKTATARHPPRDHGFHLAEAPLRLPPRVKPVVPGGGGWKGGNVCLFLPLFLSFIFVLHPSYSQASNLFKYHQVSMGTLIEITLVGDDEEATIKATLQAFQEIKRIEQLMSPWIESSDVFRINRSAGKEWVKVSPETFKVIQKAKEISELSGGGFDITVGPLTQLWRMAREKKVPPPLEELKQKLDLVNFKNMMMDQEGKVFLKKREMAIDLGGIAKGYAVDRAFELFNSLGHKNLIVNAGGDLRTGGLKLDQPWIIGIQDPRAPQKMMARVSVSDAAIATSGDYEKFFIYQGKRYHHIFNPRDGFPTEGCQSVTILCKEGMVADALATAVFVLGPEKGYALCQKLEGVDCLIVDKEGKILFSPRLESRISFNP